MPDAAFMVLLLSCLSFGSHALNRSQIADSDTDITPLLVGQATPNIDLNHQDVTGKAVSLAPGVLIVDQNGLVKFSYINPDYQTRLSPELLYQAAKYSIE